MTSLVAGFCLNVQSFQIELSDQGIAFPISELYRVLKML